VAGVALGDIHLRFAWEAWRFSDIHAFTLRDRRGTYGTSRSGGALGPSWLRRHFAWQASHLATSTFVLRCRGGTYGTALPLVAGLVGMCYSQLRASHVWPCLTCIQCFAVFVGSLASSTRLLLRHLVIYLWSGRFGSTWEETLCMFDRYFVEAMLACFCMFDRNLVEEMLACFACFALAQRGKRPCACLIVLMEA